LEWHWLGSDFFGTFRHFRSDQPLQRYNLVRYHGDTSGAQGLQRYELGSHFFGSFWQHGSY
jgi:hypothetical protein